MQRAAAPQSSQATPDRPTAEPPTPSQTREALVTLVLQSDAAGLTIRDVLRQFATQFPGADSDLRTAIETLLLLGVLAQEDQHLHSTSLTARFIEGSRLAGSIAST